MKEYYKLANICKRRMKNVTFLLDSKSKQNPKLQKYNFLAFVTILYHQTYRPKSNLNTKSANTEKNQATILRSTFSSCFAILLSAQ